MKGFNVIKKYFLWEVGELIKMGIYNNKNQWEAILMQNVTNYNLNLQT